MIELVSVELHNFRSFSNARFEPAALADGMTAVTGSNGSGKTSIIVGLLWALYGITPDGVPVKALRRHETTGPVISTVVFQHDGQKVEVTRSLRGKNDSTVANIAVDGVQQTNVSARTATAWVTARLGLDGEGFLTAFVVRQKELDDLVKARPADRRKTIERLAGVERMSEAIAKARQTARDAEQVLKAIPTPEADPTVLQEEIRTLESEIEALTEQCQLLAGQQTEAETRFAEVDQALEAAQTLLSQHQTLQTSVSVAATKLAGEQQTLTRLRAQSHSDTTVADAQQQLDGARKTLDDIREAQRGLSDAHTRVAAAQHRVDESVANGRGARETFDRQAARKAEIENRLAGFPPTLAEEKQQLRAQISQSEGALGGYRSEIEKISASIQALSGHDDPSCPTCQSILSDPNVVLTSLEASLQRARENEKETREKVEQQKARYQTVSDDLTTYTRLLDEQNTLLPLLAELEEQLTVAREAHARLTLELQEAEEALTTAATSGEKARAAQPEATQRVSECEATLSRAQTAAAVAAQIPDQEEAVAEAIAAHERLTSDLATLATQLASVDPDHLKRERAALGKSLEGLRTQNGTAASALGRLSERLKSEQATLARIHRQIQDRDQALKNSEETKAIASALDEFRKDRLARLAPELSEVASDFVSRMTLGKYVSVELDEDFTPLVMSDEGDLRPSSWLSGGEESVVALALRVAIGEVLAGQAGGLLVLDEVLTAQDADRRTAAISAIRELPRQTIMINHMAEATDVVDHVVEVDPKPDGSRLIVHDKRTLASMPDLDDETAA